MKKLEEALKNCERDAIIANLDELKQDAEFVNSNKVARQMMLSLACGITVPTLVAKLKNYGIEI